MTTDEAVHRVVSLAYEQVGYHEGANNYNKYAADPLITQLYGWSLQNQPWCAVFVNWLFLTSFGFYQGKEMTYGGSPGCAVQASFYRNNGAFFPINYAQKGDQIFFYVDGGINHTGIVVDVTGSTIRTVEGNSSDSVAERTYFVGDAKIAGVGRPLWAIVAKEASDDGDGNECGDDSCPIDFSGSTDSCEISVRVLRNGDIGNDVHLLQSGLNHRGFNCGLCDGDFGRKTEAAIRMFQRSSNLSETGVCGQDEWQVLFQ